MTKKVYSAKRSGYIWPLVMAKRWSYLEACPASFRHKCPKDAGASGWTSV